jgi:hypothetical protein
MPMAVLITPTLSVVQKITNFANQKNVRIRYAQFLCRPVAVLIENSTGLHQPDDSQCLQVPVGTETLVEYLAIFASLQLQTGLVLAVIMALHNQ